jgi:hypothetical protein
MKTNTEETLKTCEHGIQEAVYTRTAVGLQPMLVCLCGEVCQGDSWEEVGTDLDAHLADRTE